MAHQYFYFFAIKNSFERKTIADIAAVDIAVYAFEWFECGELIGECDIAKVATMPDFITIFEMPEYIFI